MTYVELAAVVALVLVVCLVVAVWRLSSQVRRLGAEVTQRRAESPTATPAAAQARASAPARSAGAKSRAPQPGVRRAETPSEVTTVDPVPVITRLADETSADGDLSTSRVASVTLGPPLIKVAAFAYGVRRALGDEQRMRVSYAVHKELRRQRKLRRRRSRETVATEGVGS